MHDVNFTLPSSQKLVVINIMFNVTSIKTSPKYRASYRWLKAYYTFSDPVRDFSVLCLIAPSRLLNCLAAELFTFRGNCFDNLYYVDSHVFVLFDTFSYRFSINLLSVSTFRLQLLHLLHFFRSPERFFYTCIYKYHICNILRSSAMMVNGGSSAGDRPITDQ